MSSFSRRVIRGWCQLHLDLDKYLNPYLSPSILDRFPYPIAHFLGHRNHPPSAAHAKKLGNVPMIFWAFVGILSSLTFIGGVVLSVPGFKSRGVPTIIGSFGAAAVLDFYAIESPLAQPRNAILGQIISSVTGIIICKLFQLSPHFESIRWVGGAFACATATAVMALTGTVHPPAGATALMAVADEDVSKLGWFLLCPVMLGCGLMLVTALLVNNVQRRFPYYWWSPGETGSYWDDKRQDIEGEKSKRPPLHSHGVSVVRKPSIPSSSSGDSENGDSGTERDGRFEVIIRRGEVIIPEGLTLRPEEVLWLETVGQRL
ncbi:HPP family-domain-containing protein [Cladorrhinum sp. PSN259]|nr:HPP family-domain-containing protein [Cladorrhinum sp. PSN259]